MGVIWREEKLHDYYLVTLSESLIFLGFSRVSAFDLMGVIWREEKIIKNWYFLGTPRQFSMLKMPVFSVFCTIPLSCIMRRKGLFIQVPLRLYANAE